MFAGAGCEVNVGEHNSGEEPAAWTPEANQDASVDDEQESGGGDAEETPAPIPASEGCTTLEISDGGGGFVSNPDNSRGTLKFVFPASYADQVSRVTVYTSSGAHFDTMYREFPNEDDGRPRYYGTKPIEQYPDNLHCQVLMNDGSCRQFILTDPQQRYD
jgi:hypothetical protein